MPLRSRVERTCEAVHGRLIQVASSTERAERTGCARISRRFRFGDRQAARENVYGSGTGLCPAANDLIGGQIDYMCLNMGSAGTLTMGKQVKAIAALSPNRSPLMPDLATAHEQGLGDFDVTSRSCEL